MKSHMFGITLLAVLAVLSSQSQAQKTGKFFYTQLYQQDYQLFAKPGLNDSAQALNLIPSTTEMTLGIYTTLCQNQTVGKNCTVKEAFNNSERVQNRNIVIEQAYFYEQDGDVGQQHIFYNVLSGWETKISLNLTLLNYYRQYNIDSFEVFLVQQLESEYKSKFASGFFGLAPFTLADSGDFQRLQRNESLIWKLYQDGEVENMVISFYVDKNSFKTTSFMKFGSYDTAGFDRNSDYHSMQTESNSSWALNMITNSYFSYFLSNDNANIGVSINTGTRDPFKFLIDPAFPFIYLPQEDIKKLVNYIKDSKETLTNLGLYEETLNFDQNVVKFDTKCHLLKNSQINYSIDFTILESATTNNNFTYKFQLEDLLVDGNMFGDTGNNGKGACYLGLFPNTGADRASSVIYAGVVFLQKFYTYFDLTNCQTGGSCDTLSVTAGLRNVSAQILQAQYNDSASFYNYNTDDQSEWTRYPNPLTHKAEAESLAQAKSVVYQNVATFVLVLIVLTITVVCLIQYKQRQDAERLPELQFKRNETIYRQKSLHLRQRKSVSFAEEDSDSDEEIKNKIKQSSSIN